MINLLIAVLAFLSGIGSASFYYHGVLRKEKVINKRLQTFTYNAGYKDGWNSFIQYEMPRRESDLD